MKTLTFYLLIIVVLLLSINTFGQRAKYKIFITDSSNRITKGKFIICDDEGITILRRGDTLHISNTSISSLYLYKRGIVFPVTILATTGTFFLGIMTGGLAITIIALPIAGGISSFCTYLLAERASYKNIKLTDFSNVINHLKQYTVKPKTTLSVN